MTETLFISDERSLGRLCERLAGAESIALDTEFMRERTYYPRLCLVQIGVPELLAVVDPLACSDLGPLWNVLTGGPELHFHAASQDLEIVLLESGRMPRRHFDTQVAAAFLGYGDSIGYARLVEQVTGASPGRSEAYTDWARRPLRPEQVEYALDDVRFLPACVDRLRHELAERGRASWVDEELQNLAERVHRAPGPDEMWRRVSGSRGLSGAALAILRAAAAWREREAMERDRPRQHVVPDRVLVEIARRAPKSQRQVERLRGLHPREAERSAGVIVDLVREAAGSAPESWPSWPERPPFADEPRVDMLSSLLDSFVRSAALQLGMSSRLISTRQELERLVRGELGGVLDEDSLALLRGWRREHAGERMLALLRGTASVRVDRDGERPSIVLEER